MTRAIQGQQIDPVPAFDWLAEEPELDLIITTRRVDPDDPKSGNAWSLKMRINGEAVEGTKTQKHYAAAVARLAAFHLSHQPKSATPTEHILYEAREAFWQLRLSLDYFVGMLRGLVMRQGVGTTADLLNMAELTVEALYRAPSAHAPTLLAEIGAFNVSRKERKKVAKTLAPLSLLGLADDRSQRARSLGFSPAPQALSNAPDEPFRSAPPARDVVPDTPATSLPAMSQSSLKSTTNRAVG